MFTSIFNPQKWLITIFCVFSGLLFANLALACGGVQESMTPEAIVARLEPVGKVNVDEADAVAKPVKAVALGPDAGEKRYKTSCAICHDQGVAGAPKFRDKAAWADRVKLGIDALTASAIKGKGGMPPRGTCMQCSDEEIKLAIEYMLPQ